MRKHRGKNDQTFDAYGDHRQGFFSNYQSVNLDLKTLSKERIRNKYDFQFERIIKQYAPRPSESISSQQPVFPKYGVHPSQMRSRLVTALNSRPSSTNPNVSTTISPYTHYSTVNPTNAPPTHHSGSQSTL